MAVHDYSNDDGDFVLAHLLTKDGALSVPEIKVLQTALIEKGLAKFDRANGTFGPGTSQAVMDYLHLPENIHLAGRLGEQVREALDINGHAGSIEALQPSLSQGFNMDGPENMSVAQLISRPYNLNNAELQHLRAGLGIAPEGGVNGELLNAVHSYIQKNPGVFLENPEMVAYLTERPTHMVHEQRQIAEFSKGYAAQVEGLAQRSSADTNIISASTYRLQHMLHAGGYLKTGGYGGEKGGMTAQALDEFKKNEDQQRASDMRAAWSAKGQDVAQLDVADANAQPHVAPDHNVQPA